MCVLYVGAIESWRVVFVETYVSVFVYVAYLLSVDIDLLLKGTLTSVLKVILKSLPISSRLLVGHWRIKSLVPFPFYIPRSCSTSSVRYLPKGVTCSVGLVLSKAMVCNLLLSLSFETLISFIFFCLEV